MYDDTKFRKRVEREFRFAASVTTALAAVSIGGISYMLSRENMLFAILIGAAAGVGTLLSLYSDPPPKPLP